MSHLVYRWVKSTYERGGGILEVLAKNLTYSRGVQCPFSWKIIHKCFEYFCTILILIIWFRTFVLKDYETRNKLYCTVFIYPAVCTSLKFLKVWFELIFKEKNGKVVSCEVIQKTGDVIFVPSGSFQNFII